MNGKDLYIRDNLGWYDLEADFYGESRYGKNYFYVKTDKNGLRINHLKNSNYLKSDEKIFFIGDSFTFGVGLDWQKSFVGILNKEYKLKIPQFPQELLLLVFFLILFIYIRKENKISY